jgi:hypothetical protein
MSMWGPDSLGSSLKASEAASGTYRNSHRNRDRWTHLVPRTRLWRVEADSSSHWSVVVAQVHHIACNAGKAAVSFLAVPPA